MRQCSVMLSQPLAVVVALLVAVSWAQDILVFQDEFDSLNLNNWYHLIGAFRGYNSEFEHYRNNRKNSYVRDGILYLQPTFTADEYGEDFLDTGKLSDPACNIEPCESAAGEDIVLPIQSARIQSSNSFSMLYGRLVIRAKMPHGDYIWPALWLMPSDSSYGQWPRSGEIDLMETRGNKNLTDETGLSQGIDSMGSTMHWGPDRPHNGYEHTHWEKRITGTGKDYGDDFYEYQLEWSPDCIKFSVDGEKIGSISTPEGGFWQLGGFDKDPGGQNIWTNSGAMAPFDRKFYIMMNVAVGGTFFSDDLHNSPPPNAFNWSSPHPMKDFWDNRALWMPTWNGEDAAMKVDYVRVYSYNPDDPVVC